MKNLFYFAFIVLIVSSCSDNKQAEEERVNILQDSLNTVIDSLNGKLSGQDSSVQAFIEGYNVIQENLDLIKEKEKILAETSKEDAETRKNKQDQIVADIQAIYDALNKNKQQLEGLKSSLSKANQKNANLKAQLQKFTERITAQLEAKEAQVADLKTQLEGLNVELTDLKTTYEETVEESQKKTEKLNTAYYTFGQAKELIKNGVLTKSGGFIGIGKIEKMKEDFNKTYFTKINIEESKVIVLSAKKAKIITTHPANSYKLQGLDGSADKLIITDAESFWSVSKYLVIVTE